MTLRGRLHSGPAGYCWHGIMRADGGLLLSWISGGCASLAVGAFGCWIHALCALAQLESVSDRLGYEVLAFIVMVTQSLASYIASEKDEAEATKAT